jgi:transposase
MRGRSDKVTYKPYTQNQPYLIPPTADELIPKSHLARLVSQTIDEMNIEPVMRKYETGGGASRYHPVMMTKLFVYGYMTKICSSRMLAKAVRENVMFMWLAGGQKPDFRTLNTFRGKLLKGTMEEIFVTAVKMLHARGHIKLENYFVDGTKIESASGRYTFVWKKAVEKNDKKLDAKIRAFVEMANDIWDQENKDYEDRDLEEMNEKEQFTSKDVKEIAEALKARLMELEREKEDEHKKKLKKTTQKALKTVEQDYLPRKKKYEQAKKICGKRNSYSKTDPDATFMRMKEDHMLNGQLKPGYNVQVGTENGFVVGYDIFPNPADSRTLKPHLKNQRKRLGRKPDVVIADAGYGGEENYRYLENQKITAAVKYAMMRKEAERKWKKDKWKTDNWEYNRKGKFYVCPNGRKLTFRLTKKRSTDAGYPVTLSVYECESCTNCRLKRQCTNAAGNRRIERNENWLRLKKKAKTTLNEERCQELYKRRAVECETVFGQIKGNLGYRRFLLRGKEKVCAEWGLLSLGYNFKRLYRVLGVQTG